ncbi:MAG: TrkH family potassium uptake protein [Clostridia bacterium]|nr:TrkH family potassium uptake protein [Clostridia bacterium]
MNYRVVFHTVGQILKVESILLLLPLAIAIVKEENTVFAFCVTIVITAALAAAFTLLPVRKKQTFAREGLLIVAFSWIIMSIIGALPMYLGTHARSYLDCLFETVSGFTTTGASVVDNVEILPKSINFWRCFTHWIGGMGILVFVLALVSGNDNNSMHILKAEVPGPITGKLVAKTKVNSRILYAIYIVLTLIEALLLKLGGNSLFDSVTIAFSTAGTGGFCSYNASIGAYHSLYTEIVCIVFMLLFSLNFNIFYLIVVRQTKRALKSEELRTFFAIVFLSFLVIVFNIRRLYPTFGESSRNALFWISSIISTTGFTTVDVNEWPKLSQHILLALMFFGGCAGSTAGGLKISRVIIIAKNAKRSLKKIIYPSSVTTVKVDGESLSDETVYGVTTFVTIYLMIFIASFLIVSADGNDLTKSFSAVASCINNVGPTLGGLTTFSSYSPLSKVVFILDMLIGRLEIYPIIVLFLFSTWKKPIRH